MAGSLCRVERTDAAGRVEVRHQLTFKQAGKTRTVYVPQDLVAEVQAWIRTHRRVKQLLQEISEMSVALIRSYGAAKRAAAAKNRPAKSRRSRRR